MDITEAANEAKDNVKVSPICRRPPEPGMVTELKVLDPPCCSNAILQDPCHFGSSLNSKAVERGRKSFMHRRRSWLALVSDSDRTNGLAAEAQDLNCTPISR